MAVNGFWERAGATNRLGFSAIGTRYDEASVFNETWFWTKEETKFEKKTTNPFLLKKNPAKSRRNFLRVGDRTRTDNIQNHNLGL